VAANCCRRVVNAALHYALLRFKVNKNRKFVERNEIAQSWEILGSEFLCRSEYKIKISGIKVIGASVCDRTITT
jgi:hypothetical protein